MRSRIYLAMDDDKTGGYKSKPEANDPPDPNYRILSLKKANLAQAGHNIGLQWRGGVFVYDDPILHWKRGQNDLERLVVEIESAFDDGRAWSQHHQAKSQYVGRWIAAAMKKTRSAAEDLIADALMSGRVVEIIYDKHTHKKGLCTPEQAALIAAKQQNGPKP